MKLTFKISDTATVELDGDSQVDVFKDLASATEVFSISSCGACQSDAVYPRVRTVESHSYPEWVCSKCKAVLALGQNRKGGSLFPKRKDSEGKWLPAGGWVVFSKSDKR